MTAAHKISGENQSASQKSGNNISIFAISIHAFFRSGKSQLISIILILI